MSKLQEYVYAIKDKSGANWALKKYSDAQEEIKKNEEFAKVELEKEKNKIDRWLEVENNKHENTIEKMQGLLAEYALSKQEDDPSFKSMSLPNGRFGFRKQQPKWNYDDEKILETLKRNNMNDFINVKESPKKADIKKAFEIAGSQVINPETGEVIEGISIEDRQDKFNVKVIE